MAQAPRIDGSSEYDRLMIRHAFSSLPRASARLLLATALTLGASPLAMAQTKPAPKAAAQKPAAHKPAAKAEANKPQAAQAEPGKPVLVATIGDWGVYVTSGREKQCYALAQPKDRAPAGLNRDPAYFFISTRPSEKVRNEVSIIMGFDVKAADKNAPEAAIGTDKFPLAAQGSHLWVRDANKAGPIVESMRKGARLTVKAASQRGNVTTDSYSLTGISGALERVQKECP